MVRPAGHGVKSVTPAPKEFRSTGRGRAEGSARAFAPRIIICIVMTCLTAHQDVTTWPRIIGGRLSPAVRKPLSILLLELKRYTRMKPEKRLCGTGQGIAASNCRACLDRRPSWRSTGPIRDAETKQHLTNVLKTSAAWWIVAAARGSPRTTSRVLAHSAAWFGKTYEKENATIPQAV